MEAEEKDLAPESIISQTDSHEPDSKKKKATIAGIAIGAILLAILVGVILLGVMGSPNTTAKVRDIFIILLALQMFVVGIALIVLVVQLASLINLLQHEVKPIIHSTSDTVNNLKGTVKFLSDNVAEPVIKLNSSIASLNKLVDLFKFKR